MLKAFERIKAFERRNNLFILYSWKVSRIHIVLFWKLAAKERNHANPRNFYQKEQNKIKFINMYIELAYTLTVLKIL